LVFCSGAGVYIFVLEVCCNVKPFQNDYALI
jgi:hypothetical protein